MARARQPVHTVYVGAHLFRVDLVRSFQEAALAALREYAPDAEALARMVDYRGPRDVFAKVYARVVAKLNREPIEDLRIDFEDGYGAHSDAHEDGHAKDVATILAKSMREKTLPALIGIRIKPFAAELKARSLRTLDIVVTTLWEAAGKKLPAPFVVTLAKVTTPEEMNELARVLDDLERKLKMPRGTIAVEMMVETTLALMDAEGRCPLPLLARAANGRCIGAHLGVYDYTASCEIAATHQSIDNPVCDGARHTMKVALAGTGVALSDGATNVLPVGDRRAVTHAWNIMFQNVRHALRCGFYQGWDLHGAQLPIRYAAVYSFFLEGIDQVMARLKSPTHHIADDPATRLALEKTLRRAQQCGAIGEDEVKAAGVT